jgi:tRNA threonylcarbamoyladenosine biosynthesis protein TsaE
MNYTANSLEDYTSIAKDLLSRFEDQRVFLLHGEMGAGKTTFTKRLLEDLGVSNLGGSPTFGIVNEYEVKSGLIYHFDCFRLKDELEAESIGMIDYLDSGNYCFIEWPERIESLLPDHFVVIKINVQDGVRNIQCQEY